MNKILLLADNKPEFLQSCAVFLEELGYTVIRAVSPEDARALLEREYVHLALLDVRLRDDDDPRDISGIELAGDSAYCSVPKIIITDYPTYDYVRAALRPSPDGPPPAVDFIKKEDGPDEMVRAIEEVFQSRLRLNENLQIRWPEEQPLSFPGLVARIESGLSSALLSSRVREIEDLFRRLFRSAEQIIIEQQHWGETGRVLLEVLVYAEGREETVLVTAGLAESTRTENDCFVQHAPHDLHAGGLALVNYVETVHYGASAWSLITDGSGVEDLATLSAYFTNHNEKQLRTVIENLFQRTLRDWTGRNRINMDQPLVQMYQERFGFDGEGMEEFTSRLKLLTEDALRRGMPEIIVSEDEVTVRLPNKRKFTVPSPTPFLFGKQHLPDLQHVLTGTSLGGLDPSTLLVDRMYRTWPSDFSRIGQDPLWLDYASLENELRFHMIDAGDLDDLNELEQCLLKATRLGENVSIEDVRADLHKLAACILSIRTQAAEAAGDALFPYEISLLFLAARDLSEYDPQRKHRAGEIEGLLHRLLFCGWLCGKLALVEGAGGAAPDDPPEAPFIFLDEANREVKIGSRIVDLTGREYDLFVYLFEHRGRLCRRAEILNNVFKTKVESVTANEENLLDINISRLRRKIEPDPDQPVFLETVRGVGFKLNVSPS